MRSEKVLLGKTFSHQDQSVSFLAGTESEALLPTAFYIFGKLLDVLWIGHLQGGVASIFKFEGVYECQGIQQFVIDAGLHVIDHHTYSCSKDEQNVLD